MKRSHLIVAGIALLVVIWFMWWRTADVQVPKTFERIKTAIDYRDSGMLLEQVHPEYPYAKLWPDMFGEETDASSQRFNPRLLAMQGMRVLFEEHANNPIVFSYAIESIRPRDDGNFDVVASVTISTQDGSPVRHVENGKLDHHRFVLARDWVSMSVIGHDPITFRE